MKMSKEQARKYYIPFYKIFFEEISKEKGFEGCSIALHPNGEGIVLWVTIDGITSHTLYAPFTVLDCYTRNVAEVYMQYAKEDIDLQKTKNTA